MIFEKCLSAFFSIRVALIVFLRSGLFLCFLCDLKFFEINLVRLPLGHFQAILTVAKIYSSYSNLISPYTADQSTQILLL